MSDPLNGIQVAAIAALRSVPAVTAIVADRIYDHVPPDAVFPYIAIGEATLAEAGGEGIEAFDIGFVVEMWSDAPGMAEVSELIDAAESALDDAEVAVGDERVGEISVERFSRQSRDGFAYGRLEFSGYVEPGMLNLPQERPPFTLTGARIMALITFRARGDTSGFAPKAAA